MNSYITGSIIKRLREEKKMTQSEFAEKLGVSDKTVSKWETGRGYPDITLLEPISAALGISLIELISGNNITNTNKNFNMKKAKFYICPVCGNIIASAGEAVVCCCGVDLISETAEDADGEHAVEIEIAEDEYYVSLQHEMTKEHYISFLAAVTDNGIKIVKLYPEQYAEARFKINRTYAIYAYCNRHGLYKMPIRHKR